MQRTAYVQRTACSLLLPRDLRKLRTIVDGRLVWSEHWVDLSNTTRTKLRRTYSIASQAGEYPVPVGRHSSAHNPGSEYP